MSLCQSYWLFSDGIPAPAPPPISQQYWEPELLLFWCLLFPKFAYLSSCIKISFKLPKISVLTGFDVDDKWSRLLICSLLFQPKRSRWKPVEGGIDGSSERHLDWGSVGAFLLRIFVNQRRHRRQENRLRYRHVGADGKRTSISGPWTAESLWVSKWHDMLWHDMLMAGYWRQRYWKITFAIEMLEMTKGMPLHALARSLWVSSVYVIW